MTIIEKAISAFYREPTNLKFGEVYSAHAMGAFSYVVKTDRLFALARQTCIHWPDEVVINDVARSTESSLLHVSLAVGDLRELISLLPAHITTITFQRRGYRVHYLGVKEHLKRF